jgi:hypothetical protein
MAELEEVEPRPSAIRPRNRFIRSGATGEESFFVAAVHWGVPGGRPAMACR